MTSIGTTLDQQKGVGPGFNLLRLSLALSVLFVHSSLLDNGATAGEWWPYGSRWALSNLAVPMFFVLSGFLVTASVDRLRFDQFLINRLVRIVPGLTVVVLFAGFVLGPLLTVDSLSAYFHDKEFHSYFLNAIGLHRDALPGLFVTNPEQKINGSLWTVPHEVSCYFLLVILSVAGVLRHRWLVLAATLGLYAAAILVFYLDRAGIRFPFWSSLTYIFLWRGAAHLVPLFLTGVLFYRFRYEIPRRGLLAFLSAALLVTVAVVGDAPWEDIPMVWLFTAPLFAYLAIYLGLSAWFAIPLLAGLDYSYGIYLYGYPVQQTLIHFMPGMRNYVLFFFVSAVPTVLLAALSWHFIEKPALGLKKRVSPAVRDMFQGMTRSGRKGPAVPVGPDPAGPQGA